MKQREVERLIKKNGFGVKRLSFGEVDEGLISCGCALTHLYCDSHIKQPIKHSLIDYNKILNWANKTYGKIFADAVMSALDNNGQETFADKRLQAKHDAGYRLGLQFSKADKVIPC